MLGDGALDLAGLDPIAVDLYLPIDASQAVERTIGESTHEITGAEPTFTAMTGQVRVDEPRILRRRTEIAEGHAGAGDPELALLLVVDRNPLFIHYCEFGLAEWSTDGDALCICGDTLDHPPGGLRGALGRAVDVDEMGRRSTGLEHGSHHRRVERFTSDSDADQRAEHGGIGADQMIEQRGGDEGSGDTRLFEPGPQTSGVDEILGADHHEAGTVAQ